VARAAPPVADLDRDAARTLDDAEPLLVAAVVAMAHGVAENNGSPALASEGAGPFNASVVPGHVQAPNMALTDSTRAIIDDLCGVARGASVAIIREWP